MILNTMLIRYTTCVFFLVILMACNDSTQSQQLPPSVTTDKEKERSTDINIWANTSYEPTDVAMELKQISPHVYYVQGPPGAPTDNDGFMSNAAVIVGEKEVVVFDSLGTPSLAYLLLSKIKKISDKPIRTVIVSHYHADHIYGLQVLKDDADAQIWAPLGAKEYLNSSAAGRLRERRESLFPWVNESTRIVKPDRYISKDEIIDIGGVTLNIVSLGSTHSDGDLMVYVKPDQVLLAGDLMFAGRIPFIAGSKPGRWLQHLNKLDPTKFKVILPGHGPVSNEPKNAIIFTKGYLNFLHTAMMKAVEELTPFDEAYANIDWGKYKDIPAFQVNRMNAYFVFLDLEEASVK